LEICSPAQTHLLCVNPCREAGQPHGLAYAEVVATSQEAERHQAVGNLTSGWQQGQGVFKLAFFK